MNDKFFFPLFVGIMLMSLASAAKAILDVNTLKADKDYIVIMLNEIKDDLKEIKAKL